MIITDKVIENHINTIIDLVKEIETNKVTVLVGQNGTGKSLIRKQMGVRFYKEYGDNKSHTRTVSMQARTESRPEFDALCTCMHDMPDEPTSLASYSLVESVMNYDMKNINDYFLIFDELEVGMSEESILGMVEYLNKNILSWLENSLGILIITHSKVLASGIMKSFDANFINLGYNTVSYDFNEWLNRKLEPADFNFLHEWSSKLYHAVSARSKSIKNNNEKR